MNPVVKKIFILLILVIILATIQYFHLSSYLSLEYIKDRQNTIQSFYQNNWLLFFVCYFLIYVVVTAVSIPGAAVLTLLGGALFGVFIGTALVSLASTLGATAAFLLSRSLLRDVFERKFFNQIKSFQDNFDKNGGYFLFSLRAIPLFPFFMVNIVMGFTKIKVKDYFFISMLGMLPGTIVFVNAGEQLADINTLNDIISLKIFLSLALLGMFPYVMKYLLTLFSQRKLYAKFKKPKKFQYNVIVIGGGAAGLVTSYIASAVKAKVALVEKHKMGGDCLNTGCVPSKSLIKTAKIISYMKNATQFGIRSCQYQFFADDIFKRIKNIIQKIEPHDSVERYEKLGVKCYLGEAKIISPYEVMVGNHLLTTKNIVIATGASPIVIPFQGLENINYKTSDNIWDIKEIPSKMLIVGAGAMGCEMAQAFSRLGSKVTIIDKENQILFREDEDVSCFIASEFSNEGIQILTNKNILRFEKTNERFFIYYEDISQKITEKFDFDLLLIALGRKANTQKFGLEDLGISLNANGTVQCDEFLRTNYNNIFVCGDVVGPYQFTHFAAHQAWYAAVNALFGKIKSFKINYHAIPRITFVDPEVAQLGLNERMAKERGISVEVVKYSLSNLDRALTEQCAQGFVKVLLRPKTDKILGVTIVGAHAGDTIAEFVLAMKYNIGLNKILSTVHAYPTFAEANKFVAGEWKKTHIPHNILKVIEKYHAWIRR